MSAQDDRPATVHVRPVRVWRDVLEELVFGARFDARPMVALLVGHWNAVQREAQLEVTGFEELHYLDEGDDAVGELRGRLERSTDDGLGQEIVCGICVGGTLDDGPPAWALELHLSFFNLPLQPLLVVDPDADRVALFARFRTVEFLNLPLEPAGGDPEEAGAPDSPDAANPDAEPA